MKKQVVVDVLKVALPVAGLFLAATPSFADDTDVYTAIAAGAPKPNVLFILDYSGSMQDDVNGGTPAPGVDSKIKILREAVEQLLDANETTVNIGIGSLYRHRASGVQWPVSDLTAEANLLDPSIPAGVTNKDVLLSQLYKMSPQNSTATVNALAEGGVYFRGGVVRHNDAGPNSWWHSPPTWDAGAGAFNGGNEFAAVQASYTPKDAWDQSTSTGTATANCYDTTPYGGSDNGCNGKTVLSCTFQAAHIWHKPAVPPSSGEGWSDPGSPAEDIPVPDRDACVYQYDTSGVWSGANYVSPINAHCGSNFIILISDGLPTQLSDDDTLRSLLPGGTSSCADLSQTIFNAPNPGDATAGNCGPEVAYELANNNAISTIPNSHISTYTVGFGLQLEGKAYLTEIADKGNGKFIPADDPASLTAALNEIIDDIIGGSENFVQLALDIDRASFSHDNKVYFPFFSPSGKDGWTGNVKGYFLGANGLLDINGNPAIDATAAIPSFAETTQSFWSDTADGNIVKNGGAAEQLTGTRQLLTYTGGGLPTTLTGGSTHDLKMSNGSLTPGLFGPGIDAARMGEIVNWINDPLLGGGAIMGDPMHSQPVPITYAGGLKVVYMSTNHGFLHAIDASLPTVMTPASPDTTGGDEIFAFIPPELLGNLDALEKGTRTGNHIYGLDGGITRWHMDDGNGIVDTGERVILVIGMRRGGGSYYAVEVTDPYAPRYLWKIDSSSPGFGKLAQTWSQPALITVHDSASSDPDKERQVLVFGGGYDGNLDNAPKNVNATGNAIYMIDETGSKLWSTDDITMPDAMNRSIAAELTVIDSDSNGKADRIYAADVGGHIWRIDFDDIKPGANSFSGRRLATLHNGTDEQPFFYPPSVATIRSSAGDYLSVSIGSGDRTNPTDMFSKNNFFMVKDLYPDAGPLPSTYNAVQFGDLHDATENPAGSNDDTVALVAEGEIETGRGWRVQLLDGEKSLSRVVTFDGNLLGTTFQVDPVPPVDQCAISNLGRFYMMSVKNATPVLALSAGGDPNNLTKLDRSSPVQGYGIPSAPAVLFPAGSGEVAIMVDKEIIKHYNQKITRVFWHAK